MLGRYHYYRLHPFSLAELLETPLPQFVPFEEIHFSSKDGSNKLLKKLLDFGGFPEPFLKGDMSELRRWQNERTDRIIKDDIRDIELVRDLSGLEVLSSLLPSKVGSLFSLNSLREDLGVAHKTVDLWVEILEHFYYHFRIPPFAANTIKSLRREPKLYLWD